MNILKIIKVLPKTLNEVRILVYDHEKGQDKINDFERLFARARYGITITIISMQLYRNRDEVISDFESVFRGFLYGVLESNKSPWEVALKYQSEWWYAFHGFVIDLLRSKLTMIGYDPKVWLEAGK